MWLRRDCLLNYTQECEREIKYGARKPNYCTEPHCPFKTPPPLVIGPQFLDNQDNTPPESLPWLSILSHHANRGACCSRIWRMQPRVIVPTRVPLDGWVEQ